jgi:hypothetical protein
MLLAPVVLPIALRQPPATEECELQNESYVSIVVFCVPVPLGVVPGPGAVGMSNVLEGKKDESGAGERVDVGGGFRGGAGRGAEDGAGAGTGTGGLVLGVGAGAGAGAGRDAGAGVEAAVGAGAGEGEWCVGVSVGKAAWGVGGKVDRGSGDGVATG